MILPSSYEVIPNDVYEDLKSTFGGLRIEFRPSIIDPFALITKLLSLKTFNFDGVLLGIRDHLAFPYVLREEDDVVEDVIESEIAIRLATILQVLDKINLKGHRIDYTVRLIHDAHSEIRSSKIVKTLDMIDISYRSPYLLEDKGDLKIVALEQSIESFPKAISEDTVETLDSKSHQMIFLRKLGILDHLRNNFALKDGSDLEANEYSFSRLVAKICRYKNTSGIREYLRDFKNRPDKVLTKKAIESVDRFISDAGVQKKITPK